MAGAGIRIDELPSSLLPALEYVFPAMRNGKTERLTVNQVSDLILAIIRGGAPTDADTLVELAAMITDRVAYSAQVKTAAEKAFARANIDLPSTLTAFQYLRVKSDGSGFELRSAQDSRADLSVTMKGYHRGVNIQSAGGDLANDINVYPCVVASANSPTVLISLPVTLNDYQLDVAFGSGKGMRFDAVISDGTWHVFLISDIANTTTKMGCSKSLNPTTAANYPAGYPNYRRIGSFTRAAGAIRAFDQVGSEVRLYQRTLEFNSASSRAISNLTLSGLPNGITTYAYGSGELQGHGAESRRAEMYVYPADQSPTGAVAIVGVADPAFQLSNGMFMGVRSNNASQIGFGITLSSGSLFAAKLYLCGWSDIFQDA